MDIKEFVSETIKQIVDGVVDAQKQTDKEKRILRGK